MKKLLSYVRWVVPISYALTFLPALHADPAPVTPVAQEQLVAAPEKAVAAEPVQAALVAEDKSIQAGRPFWVGVELKMAQGWDTYWQNPGDAGLPTQIEWQLPDGFTAGPIEWPYPERFTTDSMVGFGYTDSVLLLTKITPPKNFSGESIDLKANVTWLACKESCQPGQADLHLSLPVTDGVPTPNGEVAAQFSQAKQALPQQASVSVQTTKEAIVLNFQPSAEGVSNVQFIPEKGEVIDYQAPQDVAMSKGGVTLSMKRSEFGDVLPNEIKGVLLFSDPTGIQHALQVDSSIGQHVAAELSGFWLALGFAFLGGLILNVMPCVMPVIALKIFSFVKMAHEKRSLIFKHGLVFAAGVIVSFWVLSGALLLLRAFGESVGWGFQLQEPVFVAILAGMLFLLGLSLFGVFELGTSLISVGQKAPSTKSPMLGSFMSGVLATLVATPCTGPLLGPALGFAMSLSPAKALLIFTGMGIGMASPYLLFSAFPKLIRFLPKPGNWMITFKQIMGFLMMGTVAWLVWVFGAQTGNVATFLLLGSLLVMSVGAWIFGHWGTPMRKKVTRRVATVLAAVTVLFGGGTAVMTAKNFKDTETTLEIANTEGGWQSYSPERVQELQAAGTPVFVDFTAKWCLICQANKVTLHSSEVSKAFNENGVVTMMADWTKKDAVITAQLEKLGRTGVPVYVLYPGKSGAEPYVLPQTLSGKVLHEYMAKLNGSN